MAEVNYRPWTAVCQFEGKDKFLLGTVSMPDGSRLDEVEQEIYRLADSILPDRPKVLELLMGALFFSSEEG